MVKTPESTLVRALLTGSGASRVMDQPFIACRATLEDACRLIATFGEDAALEAATLAEGARDRGNVVGFCHWRQIERVIVTLASDEPLGTVH